MDRAITLGMTDSAFPASFDGSGGLFAFVLFAMIVASCLSSTLALVQIKQLWADRRHGHDPAWAINSAVLTSCITVLMLCVPDTTYMISFGDAEPATLQAILLAKRFFDFLFLAPLIYSMAVFVVWREDIFLKLRSPPAPIYSGYRYARLIRFGGLVALCFGLAVAVTLGRLYH
jgi:hypothetical protein